MAVYRVDFPGLLATGEQYQFSVHTQGTANDSLAAAAADDALDALLAGASDLWTDNVSFAAPRVTQLASSAGFPAVSQQLGTSSGVGTGSGSMLPPQVAICVSLRTALVGRAFRGRFYLPGPSTVQITDVGRLGGTAVEAATTGTQGMLAALLAGGYIPVIAHRASGTNTICVSADLGDVLDTQRRRRNALGEVRTPAWDGT